MSSIPQEVASQPPSSVSADMSFEEAMKALDEQTRRLESGELGLAESLAAYQHGSALLKHAQALLTHAQRELDIIDAQGSRSVARSDILTPEA